MKPEDFSVSPLTPIPLDQQDANDELPWVTHEGTIKAPGKTLRVYQLSDGQRIINAEDVEAFFAGGQ
jgi:hypothetical protein